MYRPRKHGMRGLGAAQAITDPNTGQVYVVPITSTEVDISASGSPAQYFDLTSGTPAFIGAGSNIGGSSLTAFLNNNSTTVLIGGAAFFFLLMAMGRRG